MKSSILAIAMSLYACAHMAVAADEPTLVSPENVLSSLTGDWNDDGKLDRAVLVREGADGTDITLFIYLGQSGDYKLVLKAKNLAWAGTRQGSTPSLATAARGALTVRSQNEIVGRGSWNKIFTLKLRAGKFLISAYRTESIDTTNPSRSSTCKVDLEAGGAGKLNGQDFQSVLNAPIPADEWSEEKAEYICKRQD